MSWEKRMEKLKNLNDDDLANYLCAYCYDNLDYLINRYGLNNDYVDCSKFVKFFDVYEIKGVNGYISVSYKRTVKGIDEWSFKTNTPYYYIKLNEFGTSMRLAYKNINELLDDYTYGDVGKYLGEVYIENGIDKDLVDKYLKRAKDDALRHCRRSFSHLVAWAR